MRSFPFFPCFSTRQPAVLVDPAAARNATYAWLRENKLDTDENLKKIAQYDDEDFEAFSHLPHIKFTDLKKIHAVIPQNLFNKALGLSAPMQKIKVYTQLQYSQEIQVLATPSYRIKLSDLTGIMNLFSDIHEFDKSFVVEYGDKYNLTSELDSLKQLVASLALDSSTAGQDLFQQNLNHAPLRLLDRKQLYLVAAMLAALMSPIKMNEPDDDVAQAIAINHFDCFPLFNGLRQTAPQPIDGPYPEEHARVQLDFELRHKAFRISREMFGDAKTAAILSTWNALPDYFTFNFVEDIVSLPTQHAFYYASALYHLATKAVGSNYYNYVRSSMLFLKSNLNRDPVNYMTEGLPPGIFDTIVDTRENIEELNAKFIRLIKNTQHPVVELAHAEAWLGVHGINTMANQQAIIDANFEIGVLDDIFVEWPERKLTGYQKMVNQEVFDVIRQAAALQAQNTLASAPPRMRM
jgi:hypothetical protein